MYCDVINSAEFEKQIKSLYGTVHLERQKERYKKLFNLFNETFNISECMVLSAPGRTELGGNHTDHNHGKVLAASISLDVAAVAAPAEDMKVELVSFGYDDMFSVDLNDLSSRENEKETTNALIRGVAAGFKNNGYKIGGVRCTVHSEVFSGSGLSSSAAFEILIGTVFNHLYNDGKIGPVHLAQIGQFAENEYFGKPCGLMDQLGCACGGMISIDFEDEASPKIDHMTISFEDYGYRLLVVDTGGSHADLTEDYASIPEEMKSVAREFDKEVCREVEFGQLYTKIPELRERVGDRALLRTLHFISENERVTDQIKAAKQKNIPLYLHLVKESGRSSFQYLQNIYTVINVKEQGVSLALALTDLFLSGEGAFRVQGGGFAGTIQVYVPVEKEEAYIDYIEHIFGKGCATKLRIRTQGTVKII